MCFETKRRRTPPPPAFFCFFVRLCPGYSDVLQRPSRLRHRIQPVMLSGQKPLGPGPGDHRGIVCTQSRRGAGKAEPLIAGCVGQARPDDAIGRNAAGNN